MSQIVQQPDAHFPLCDVDDAIIKRQKRRMPAPSIKAAATTTTEVDGEEQQQQAEGSVATSTAAAAAPAPEAAARRASKMVTLPGKVKPHYALVVVAVVVLTK